MLFFPNVSLTADALLCAWSKTPCAIAAAASAAGSTKKAGCKAQTGLEGQTNTGQPDSHFGTANGCTLVPLHCDLLLALGMTREETAGHQVHVTITCTCLIEQIVIFHASCFQDCLKKKRQMLSRVTDTAINRLFPATLLGALWPLCSQGWAYLQALCSWDLVRTSLWKMEITGICFHCLNPNHHPGL